jgi:hypothetical protein
MDVNVSVDDEVTDAVEPCLVAIDFYIIVGCNKQNEEHARVRYMNLVAESVTGSEVYEQS